jgi:hypothetical protein
LFFFLPVGTIDPSGIPVVWCYVNLGSMSHDALGVKVLDFPL